MSFGKIKLFGTQALFTVQEKRNILIYIFGIMLYKFGVEAFNGSVITLATNRYDQDAYETKTETRTFEKIGLLIGVNQASQCIGSILIGPLIKRWQTQVVLSATIFIFALSTTVFMIIDSATGGYIKPKDFQPQHKNDFSYYGNYSTDIIIPIYCASGITFGMVESIRRVIPANIAGDNVIKLRKMDALVHVFYEIAGVSGALMTALVLIPRLGNNHAFIITPILFTASGLIWLFIRSIPNKTNDSENKLILNLKKSKINYFKIITNTLLSFIQSIFIGGKIVFTSRKFIWLFAVYPLAVYSHRYIENGVAPQVARRYLQHSDWSQILVGGSNFGELLGALFVFFSSDTMKSPILWVRFDAFLLLVIWYIPFYYPPVDQIKYAWIIAASLIPVGFASAIGDISLDSYIQSSLTRLESKHKNISPLGAVMAFLYSTYIIIYSIANPFLGRYIDYIYNKNKTVHSALIYTAAVQLTIIFLIMFVATFIPKGAIAFNPILIDEDDKNITSDNDEKLNVMSDKNIDHDKIEIQDT
jgi:MFS family permease